mgnify:CR=1 FL=1
MHRVQIIVHLYHEVGVKVASMLDGDFAFVLLDEETGELYAARDPVGVNSLYMGTGLDGGVRWTSDATMFNREAAAAMWGSWGGHVERTAELWHMLRKKYNVTARAVGTLVSLSAHEGDVRVSLDEHRYNWADSIKIPAPCMLADKIAIYRSEIGNIPSNMDLHKLPFFL